MLILELIYYGSGMQKEVYEFISKKTDDPIVEWRICSMTGEDFPIYASDVVARKKISPTLGGKTYMFPLPDRSWQSRMTEKCAVRNNRFLYRRTCDLTGKSIISLYDPDGDSIVYSYAAWHSDAWDALSFGVDVDFSRSVLEQLRELNAAVPKMAVFTDAACQNCAFATGAINSKNCYLTDTCSYTENAWYSSFVLYCENIVDCYKCDHITNCYMSVWCQNATNLQYCVDVSDSSDCMYSLSLRNCQHCFGCTNLVNRAYCFYNEQLSKEQYVDKLSDIYLGSYLVRQQLWQDFLKIVIPKTILRAAGNTNVENCIGDGINNSKNIFFGFEILESQDMRYATDAPPKNATVVDASYMVNAERVYNSFSAVGTGIYCSLFCRNSSNVYYSKGCQNCHNIFGCVGLANKKYCIFNKQYSPEEYSHRMTEIIELMMTQGERGDFPYMGDFGYNESLAMEHFPLSKEEALRRGFSRQDKEITINIPDHIEAKDISVIPDSIVDIDDSVLEDVYVCPETGKPFRIISSELAFYHKNNIPLPRVHQDVRYAINRAYIPSRDFYLRTCDITGEEVFSIFSENSPYKVVNNETYDKAMYG